MGKVVEAVPFESGRLTPAFVAGTGIMLASVAVSPAVLVITRLLSPHQLGEVATTVMISTALLTTIVALRAPRALTAGRAAGTCMLLSGLLGAVNVGLSMFLIELSSGDLGAALRWLVGGSLLGIFVGGPIGLFFGAGFIFPATAAVRARDGASYAAVDHTLFVVGLWLAAVGAVALGLIGVSSPLGLPAHIACAGGAGAAAAGGLGLLRRHRWLRRVREGHVTGWAIETRDTRAEELTLRPFVHRSAAGCGNVLVRRENEGAYRLRGDATPIALC